MKYAAMKSAKSCGPRKIPKRSVLPRPIRRKRKQRSALKRSACLNALPMPRSRNPPASIRHRIEAGGLLLLGMGMAYRRALLFRALLCFVFSILGLGRTLLFWIFLGPQLFADFIAAYFIKLSREIGLARPPALRGLGLFLLGRPLLEMLASRFGGSCLFLRLLTVTADNAAVSQV